MDNIIVTGIGTDVGKTVVSAILTTLLEGDYWKPISCGALDSHQVREWIPKERRIFPSQFALQAPLSPHMAAMREGVQIKKEDFKIPQTKRPLIIEGAGGLCVPLSFSETTLDLFREWDAKIVVVSRHYLGSINHTLMTLEILKHFSLPLLGIVFNGSPCEGSEKAILSHTPLPIIGRVLPETIIDQHTIQRYANTWKRP